jgi:hypothetical protein
MTTTRRRKKKTRKTESLGFFIQLENHYESAAVHLDLALTP